MNILMILALAAQSGSWTETRFHRVHLRNGNFIDGQLLRQSPAELVVEVSSGAEMGVRRDQIRRVEFVKIRSYLDKAPIAEAPAVERIATPVVDAVQPARITTDARRAVDTLIAVYNATNRETRRPLGRSLRELGSEAVAYACTLLMGGPAPMERSELVEALATCDAPEVGPALIEAAGRAPDCFVRAAAVRVLAKSGTPEASAAVLLALGDASGPVARVAGEEILSLMRKGSVAVEDVVALMDGKTEKSPITKVLGLFGGTRAVEALRALLREGTSNDRVAAMQALVDHPDAEDVELAMSFTEGEDVNLRRDACLFLGRVKSSEAGGLLVGLLGDEDDTVVDAAYWALRQISGKTWPRDSELWARWAAGATAKLP